MWVCGPDGAEEKRKETSGGETEGRRRAERRMSDDVRKRTAVIVLCLECVCVRACACAILLAEVGRMTSMWDFFQSLIQSERKTLKERWKQRHTG